LSTSIDVSSEYFCYLCLMDVLVLSTGFEPLYLVGWSQALADVERGRVEIIQHYKDRKIGTVLGSLQMPKIIRFLKGVFKRRNVGKKIKLNRRSLFERDNGSCQYCNLHVSYKHFEMEHVIPRSLGGKTTWENIVVSCRKCNSRKGAQTPSEAGMKLKKKPLMPKQKSFFKKILRPDLYFEYKSSVHKMMDEYDTWRNDKNEFT